LRFYIVPDGLLFEHHTLGVGSDVRGVEVRPYSFINHLRALAWRMDTSGIGTGGDYHPLYPMSSGSIQTVNNSLHLSLNYFIRIMVLIP